MKHQYPIKKKNTIAPTQTQSNAIARSSLHPIEEMQALYGNRAVNQLLASQPRQQAKPMFRGLSKEIQNSPMQGKGGQTPSVLQAKVEKGAVGDKHEQEADRVAAQELDGQKTPAIAQTTEQKVQRQESKKEDIKDLAENTVQNGQEERKRTNQTGLPDALKAGVENLSGYSLDDVRVHYNSPKPAELQALAYTQGTEIHVAPGQEEHLPHEAWHVVQQKQHRVKAETEYRGYRLNTSEQLEEESERQGKIAEQKARVIRNTGELAKARVVPTPKCAVQRIIKWKQSPPGNPEEAPIIEFAEIGGKTRTKTGPHIIAHTIDYQIVVSLILNKNFKEAYLSLNRFYKEKQLNDSSKAQYIGKYRKDFDGIEQLFREIGTTVVSPVNHSYYIEQIAYHLIRLLDARCGVYHPQGQGSKEGKGEKILPGWVKRVSVLAESGGKITPKEELLVQDTYKLVDESKVSDRDTWLFNRLALIGRLLELLSARGTRPEVLFPLIVDDIRRWKLNLVPRQDAESEKQAKKPKK